MGIWQDLTGGQKIQIGIFVAVLGLAGYMLFQGTRPPPDLNITSWVEQKVAGRNPAQPISPTNPADPRQTTIVTNFASFDGRLQIIEYAPETQMHAYFNYIPDLRRKSFLVYKDLLLTIHDMPDPYRRAIEYRAYRFIDGWPVLNLFNAAALTPDQQKIEKDARVRMTDSTSLMTMSAQSGLIESGPYKKVMDALAAYRAKPGDPTKDPAKAALAHKVVQLAVDYISSLEQKKQAAMDEYFAKVDALLTPDQKAKVKTTAASVTVLTKPPRTVTLPRPPPSQ